MPVSVMGALSSLCEGGIGLLSPFRRTYRSSSAEFERAWRCVVVFSLLQTSAYLRPFGCVVIGCLSQRLLPASIVMARV